MLDYMYEKLKEQGKAFEVIDMVRGRRRRGKG